MQVLTLISTSLPMRRRPTADLDRSPIGQGAETVSPDDRALWTMQMLANLAIKLSTTRGASRVPAPICALRPTKLLAPTAARHHRSRAPASDDGLRADEHRRRPARASAATTALGCTPVRSRAHAIQPTPREPGKVAVGGPA